jgi:DNA repair exonuclease SbcCD nuclease subunit
MKILGYADIHLREFGSFSPWNKVDSNGLTLELNNIIKGCRFVANMIAELQPDMVVNLGDIFNNQETISVKTLHGVHLGLRMIHKACGRIPHFAIPGTHDTYSEMQRIYSISPLQGYFTEIFTEVKYVQNDSTAFIPYMSNPEEFYKAITSLKPSVKLVFCHHDFAGAKYENGHESESLISPQLPFTVMAGDIHLPQSVGSVIYVGSLVQNKFQQYRLNDNGIIIFDTEKNEFIRYRNNLSKHYLVLDDLDILSELDPDKVILKVISDISREEAEKILSKFEYVYFPKKAKKGDEEEKSYSDLNVENPVEALRNYVAKDKPEALEILDKVVRKEK